MQNLVELFEQTVLSRGREPAIRFSVANLLGANRTHANPSSQFLRRTWNELDQERKALAAALIELGIGVGARAALFAATQYRWILVDLALLSIGGVSVAAYPETTDWELVHILNDAQVRWVFVGNHELATRLLRLRGKLEKIQKVIVLDGSAPRTGAGQTADLNPWITNLDELLSKGRNLLPRVEKELHDRKRNIGPQDAFSWMYTSGTTGLPKGVILTHGNFLYEVDAIGQAGLIDHRDVGFLFLPLAHSFARLISYCWIAFGHELTVESSFHLAWERFPEVRPTVSAVVPRFLEKIYAQIELEAENSGRVSRNMFRECERLSQEIFHRAQMKAEVPSWIKFKHRVLSKTVFPKIRAKIESQLGGRFRFFVCGGAALSSSVAHFFEAIGIPVLEGYGLTETSAATTVNRPYRRKLGTVGQPIPGTELKIQSDGEIWVRGPGIMRGYHGLESETRAILQNDGWLKTGDIGRIDAEGFLTITDRKQDIIALSTGKSVAPKRVEACLKEADPLIAHVVVVGEQQKYIVALITLDQGTKQRFFKGFPADDERLLGRITRAVDRANKKLDPHEAIKRFKVLDQEFALGEELTPTLKVKRKFCTEKYRSVLDRLYDEANVD